MQRRPLATFLLTWTKGHIFRQSDILSSQYKATFRNLETKRLNTHAKFELDWFNVFGFWDEEYMDQWICYQDALPKHGNVGSRVDFFTSNVALQKVRKFLYFFPKLKCWQCPSSVRVVVVCRCRLLPTQRGFCHAISRAFTQNLTY